jgi:hypothetical protein
VDWQAQTQAGALIAACRRLRCGRKAPACYAGAMLTDRDTLLRKLNELRSEHRDLDTVIARLSEQRPIDQLQLQRLKKRKLLLKDEIARLESRLIPDDIA